MTRKQLVLLYLALALATWAGAAQPTPVTIMTQNMDAGTDLTYVVAGLLGYIPGGLAVGVELTYEEILAAQIATRADLLAGAVADKRPDLLALQEVTLWRTGNSVTTATTVVADQLQLLLSGLAAKGMPYDLAVVNLVNDVALPKASGGAFRMTDRDVLLIRSDLLPPGLHLSDVHANIFDAVYSLGGLQVPAGWISAMVHSGNRHFRLLTTHLQSPVTGDPSAAGIQAAQAAQLLHEVRDSTVPVVIAGDFNSDAIAGSSGRGPDNTGTAAAIVAAGYTDVWAAAGSGLGPTWPFYLEDLIQPPAPPPFVIPFTPFERIDLIFSQGLMILDVEQVIAPGPNVSAWPYYASDHAGVLAKLEF